MISLILNLILAYICLGLLVSFSAFILDLYEGVYNQNKLDGPQIEFVIYEHILLIFNPFPVLLEFLGFLGKHHIKPFYRKYLKNRF